MICDNTALFFCGVLPIPLPSSGYTITILFLCFATLANKTTEAVIWSFSDFWRSSNYCIQKSKGRLHQHTLSSMISYRLHPFCGDCPAHVIFVKNLWWVCHLMRCFTVFLLLLSSTSSTSCSSFPTCKYLSPWLRELVVGQATAKWLLLGNCTSWTHYCHPWLLELVASLMSLLGSCPPIHCHRHHHHPSQYFLPSWTSHSCWLSTVHDCSCSRMPLGNNSKDCENRYFEQYA